MRLDREDYALLPRRLGVVARGALATAARPQAGALSQVAASSSSPNIDLTGNRRNARIVPTGSLELILSPPELGSLSALSQSCLRLSQSSQLGLSLNVGCVAVNGHSFSPLLRS